MAVRRWLECPHCHKRLPLNTRRVWLMMSAERLEYRPGIGHCLDSIER